MRPWRVCMQHESNGLKLSKAKRGSTRAPSSHNVGRGRGGEGMQSLMSKQVWPKNGMLARIYNAIGEVQGRPDRQDCMHQ